MIKNIVFDFGKVLVQYDFMHYLEPKFGSRERAKEFIDNILTDYWIARIDKEEDSLDKIVEDMKIAHPSFEREIDLFAYPVSSYVVHEVPGMYELLTELKSKGYRLLGLSNWCHVVYSVIPQYKVLQLLEGQVISSDEKLVKPEPAIYNRLLEKFDLKADECVFIDDKKINVDGAKSCGMHGFVFTNAEQLRKDLETIL